MSSSFATPRWIVAHQAPLSRDFPGKNTEVGCHFLSPGDLPDPRIKPRSPAWQADSLPLTHQGISHIYHTSQQTHPEWPACLKIELGILGLKVINTTGLPCGKKSLSKTLQNHSVGCGEDQPAKRETLSSTKEISQVSLKWDNGAGAGSSGVTSGR